MLNILKQSPSWSDYGLVQDGQVSGFWSAPLVATEQGSLFKALPNPLAKNILKTPSYGFYSFSGITDESQYWDFEILPTDETAAAQLEALLTAGTKCCIDEPFKRHLTGYVRYIQYDLVDGQKQGKALFEGYVEAESAVSTGCLFCHRGFGRYIDAVGETQCVAYFNAGASAVALLKGTALYQTKDSTLSGFYQADG